MSWKTKYACKRLKRKASATQREVKLFDFESAKEIGILWELENKEAYRFVCNELKKKFKITSICYTGDSEEIIEDSFGKKDMNWFGFPKSAKVHQFNEMKFDLLMSLSITNCFPIQVVTSLSKAKFKIGWPNNTENYFDLAVDVSKNPDSKFLAEQLFYYLKEFNKK